ncbi:hypothetical protein [Amycolatopsis azurea]|uniref:Uncharacterized protein n=1 Tax=Amycolatopsis azurea DSM 43854 TaxID=1238180 RepID=M2NYA5_9PSEU|nr:hypothetical protein [Amycolatopsis azurea]EMD27644.1 hypothetical protein C791_1940 [Amycolatopsis azurea DSM 43854]OOC03046.1 hypothetical protein B0293_29205 [Amycolatopsis azurea DSM 43854]
MDFDEVADELYAGDPAEFVPVRNQRAKEAKAAGEAALAERIRALRKPTLAATILNRRAGSPELAELARLGDDLRKAHSALAGAELRKLTRRRQELVNRILQDERSMSEPVTREVEATLEAVVADPEVAALALAGRLSSGADSTGDQWLTSGFIPQPKREKPAPEREKPATVSHLDDRRKAKRAAAEKAEQERIAKAREEAEREQKRLAEFNRLRREAADLAKACKQAEIDLVRAERRTEKATEKANDLRRRLADAELEEQAANGEATSAQTVLDDLRAEADRIDEALKQF